MKRAENNKKIKTETTTELDDVKIKQGASWIKSQKDNIPKVNYAEGSYGELHIYHDQTPMKFIKA